jgi:hypothetical protein
MTIPVPDETNAPPVSSRAISQRLIRWFTYNFIFALIPIAASLAIHGLAGQLTFVALVNSPEILFFALMVGATASGDISEVSAPLEHDIQFRLFKSFLLVGTAVAALFYGVFIYDSVINPVPTIFRSRLLLVSIGLAVVMFGVSTAVEAILGKIERK